MNRALFTPLLTALGVTVVGGVSAQAIPPSQQRSGCPTKVEDYEIRDATLDTVKHCLGAPRLQGHSPEKLVFIYDIEGVGSVSFLFDSSGRLMRTRTHKSYM